MSNLSQMTTGIVAAGATQVTATPIWAYSFYNQVATCTSAANGVALPGAITAQTLGNSALPVYNQPYVIRNDGVASLNVWPQTGGIIDALVVNTAFSIPSGSAASFTAVSSTQWLVSNFSGSAGLPISAAMTALAGGAQPALAANVIPLNQSLTLIGTCASSKDSIALPDAPLLNQPYLVINNGVATCALWPGLGVAASLIDSITANRPFFLGAKARCSFTAVSNVAGVIQWFSSGYAGSRPIIPITTTAVSGTMDQSHNGVIYTAAANGANVAMTLPALTAGYYFDVVISANQTNTIIFTPTAGVFGGWVGTSAGAAAVSNVAVAGIANATLTIAATSVAGDHCQVFCDGVKWYAYCQSRAAAGITMP